MKAGGEDRTPDLRVTNAPLCQLSYSGTPHFISQKTRLRHRGIPIIIENMDASYLFVHYLSWHYGRGIAELNLFWKNMAIFAAMNITGLKIAPARTF